ncbi:MAG: oligosaccharide flippase family protein [Candidatus Levybacteria bacterium]|nr:oligosaccharide flippase family protein [Candidatus Levybacteria bacterium]
MTFGVGVSWIVIKDRPSWKFKKKYLREISQFMRSIIPMNILNFAVNQYDVLFVGRFSGPSMVGIYQLGQKFSSVPLIELSDIFGKVTFPIYTKFAEDRVRLLNAYMRIVLSVLIIGFIGVVFLFTASSYLIRFLGPSWSGISSFFPVLLAYGFLMSLWGTTGSLFLSLSAQVILARIAFIRFLLTIPIVGAATYLYGITGTAWGLLLSILMVIPITVYYFLRFFHRKNKG